MSDKMTCPGCDAHTSDVAQAHYEDQPCPYCGLSASAMREILAVRRKQADEELKTAAEDALVKLGRAEGELRTLRYRLQRVEQAFKDALVEEVPEWWRP